MAFRLQVRDHFFFSFRQHTGNDPWNIHPFPNRFRRPLVVAGQHHYVNSQFFKFRDSLSAGFLFPVRHGNDAQQFFIFCKQQRGLACICQLVQFAGYRRNINARLFHQRHIARAKLTSVLFRLHTFAEKSNKIVHLRDGNLLFRCIFHHRACQGMTAAMLQSCRRGKQRREIRIRFIGGTAKQNHIGDPGLSFRNGTRLIQHYRIQVMRCFQRFPGFDQDSVLRAFSGSHHNRHRRSQTQRAGAADDQYTDGTAESEFKTFAPKQPENAGCQCNEHDHRYKYTGYFIRHAGNGGLAAAGFVHQPDNLTDRAVFPYPLGCKMNKPGFIDGGADDCISRLFFHRDALPGNGRFIHAGSAADDHPVCRNAFAGAHHDFIAFRQFFRRNDNFRAVPDDRSLFRRQVHQFFNGAGGAAFGTGFQPFAEGNQGDDHTSRFKIQIHAVQIHQRRIAVTQAPADTVDGKNSVNQRGAGPYRHQRIHVGTAHGQTLKSADKKLFIDNQNGQYQDKFRKSQPECIIGSVKIILQNIRNRKTEKFCKHRRHGKNHHRN